MREEIQAAIDMLYGLKRGVYLDQFGICANLLALEGIGGISHRFRQYLKSMMSRWPEYSGDRDYPVAGTAEYGMDAEHTYDNTGTGEYWSGEYGGNRIRLVNFLIRELEQELRDAQ